VRLGSKTTTAVPAAVKGGSPGSDRYKWIALSNVTLGVLLATLDGSIVLIAMPDIFRGIHLDPLVPANSFYLLWMILGFLVVTSVLIVSFGRLGDMFGRVRMYNLGFVVYTAASLALTVDWLSGPSGAIYLIGFRLVQGVGAAFLLANSAAILTDAFPAYQRGMAPAQRGWSGGLCACRSTVAAPTSLPAPPLTSLPGHSRRLLSTAASRSSHEAVWGETRRARRRSEAKLSLTSQPMCRTIGIQPLTF
jgi:MFS family permease